MAILLLFSLFVISTCGLVYELIAGTLASYLLGDSITQFSTVIGVYLFSMGVGSYLSKYIDKKLVEFFIQIELLIGLIGGFSTVILFIAFHYVTHFKLLLYTGVFLIGTLIGLEIPIMIRILKSHYTDFKDLISRVFTFDYIGALLASLLFPLVLVPYVGLVRSAFLFGFLNTSISFLAIHAFKAKLVNYKAWYRKTAICSILLLLGFAFSNKMTSFAESNAFEGKIILSQSTPYQRIILSREANDLKLYLNGNLQFNSKDEYRYHEALVHVGLSQLSEPKKVLVLGGGDGLAVREILKYPSIESVVLVDLDPAMTKLFTSIPMLKSLNQNALLSNKVQVINADAFLWLKENQQRFDFIVIDFPDPSNFSLGKLYTTTFYKYLNSALYDNGLMAVQATSPFIARKSYWCIAHTLTSASFYVRPYFTYVPAFGYWGFHLAQKSAFFSNQYNLPKQLYYLNNDLIPSLYAIPPDMAEVPTETNSLTNQALVRYFEQEWQQYVL